MRSAIAIGAGILAVATCLVAVTARSGSSRAGNGTASAPRIENRLPWHGAGVWLSGDLHTHYVTRAKRGPAIVGRAAAAGLDFLVSTEHAEDLTPDGTPRALERLRRRFPGLVLIAGSEWNVPGAGHATLLVGDGTGANDVLLEFAERFDRKVNDALVAADPDIDGLTWGELRQAAAGVRWLTDPERSGPPAAVVINHPTKDGDLDLADWRQLLEAGLAGLEAAPGHQNQEHPGGEYTLDRHEPLVIRVGDDYDRLLSEGYRAALTANSDFHVRKTSFLPGAFARTLVYAPERSATGVVRGIAAGATATVHANLVSRVETRATTRGFGDHAAVGETLVVPAGAEVTYTLNAFVRAVGSIGRRGLDQVEFISDFSGAPEIVGMREGVGLGDIRLDYRVPAEATAHAGKSFYLRVRGRQRFGGPGHDKDNADLLFHVSATRVRVVEAAPQRSVSPR